MKYKVVALMIVISCIYDGLTQTNTTHTIQHNGLTREYKVYVPAIYNANNAVPLVFNLHGYTSNFTEQEAYGNFRPIADTANFIIVHPNGTLDGSGNRYWNAFGFGADDVGFISLLIDHLSGLYTIDQNRIYSTGMSNGGFMSVELACALSNRIAAVASVTGSMGVNRIAVCNPSKPTPVMQINGTSDATVTYNGTVQYASIESVVDFWVDKNNCNPTPTVINVPNTNTTDGSTVEHYIYTNGEAGSSVELYKVIGGGHTWPGAPIDIPFSGNTNRDINASKEIWRFFSQYRLNELVAVNDITGLKKATIYPNPSPGQFTIEYEGKIDEIKVFDMTGRSIFIDFESVVNHSFTIRETGVYFLQISSEGNYINSKIVVE